MGIDENAARTRSQKEGISLVPCSNMQSDVWDHPREVDTGGWREEFGGRRARGFRRGKGCRDQLLTLMLLGQIKAMLKRGMFAGLIDFRKAYIEWTGRNCGAV